jgi:hypothetical protein
MIRELEKVDDRFFEAHDSCEEEVEELDATVPSPDSHADIIVAQRSHGGTAGRMV